MYRVQQLHRIIERKKRYLKKINNTPVIINNLMVSAVNDEESQAFFGERCFLHPRYNFFDRIIDSIKILASVANQYHQEKNFFKDNNIYKLKPSALNTITRISTPEFSFFPKERPLSEEEFINLIGKIYKDALNYHDNLHLLLSSMPVKNAGNITMNYVIYVECGQDPQIHVFAKRLAADNDHKEIKYNGSFLYDTGSKRLYAKFDSNEASKLNLFSSLPNCKNKNNLSSVSHESVFICKTKGNIPLIIAIDICLEAVIGYAKKFLRKKIKIANNDFNISAIGKQIDYIIISNGVRDLLKKNINGHFATIIDACEKRSGIFFLDNARFFNKIFSSPLKIDNMHILNNALHYIRKKYPFTNIVRKKTKSLGSLDNIALWIKNPPFGSDYIVSAYKPINLLALKNPEFSNYVNKINKSNIEKIFDIESLMSLFKHPDTIVEILMTRTLGKDYHLLNYLSDNRLPALEKLKYKLKILIQKYKKNRYIEFNKIIGEIEILHRIERFWKRRLMQFTTNQIADKNNYDNIKKIEVEELMLHIDKFYLGFIAEI